MEIQELYKIKDEELIYKEIKQVEFNCFDDFKFLFFLINLSNGKEFIKENILTIIDKVNNKDDFIKQYVQIFKKDYDALKKLAYNDDLYIRGLFIKNASECDSNIIWMMYENICDYLKSNNELMDEAMVSKIATSLLNYKYDEELFNLIKEFIFYNYEYNHLLSYMYQKEAFYESDTLNTLKELKKDTYRLYKTSIDFKLEFYTYFSHLLPKKAFKDLKNAINPFIKERYKIIKERYKIIEELFKNELGDTFIKLVKKYQDLSKNKKLSIGKTGTTTFIFNIGDYVLKYINNIYSIYGAEAKCPSCFLINKSLEEIIVYDEFGNFKAMIEVQKKLKTPLQEDEIELQEQFLKELQGLGFFITDDLVYKRKYNVYKLDDYHDADCEDPEKLPTWFKENPYVLVDKDLVYPLEAIGEIGNSLELKKYKKII